VWLARPGFDSEAVAPGGSPIVSMSERAQRFVESGFRQRFEAKGRLQPDLAAIPTYVITHKLPAFLGCTALLAEA
jgi:glucokinase